MYEEPMGLINGFFNEFTKLFAVSTIYTETGEDVMQLSFGAIIAVMAVEFIIDFFILKRFMSDRYAGPSSIIFITIELY